MATVFENIFETVNSGFAQAVYEDYLRDPNSVSPEWRALFENGLKGEVPGEGEDETADEDIARERPATSVAVADSAPATSRADTLSEPITGPALRLLQNMEASLSVPTATSFRDIDVTKLWDTRKALNAALAAAGEKLSFTHLVGWAIVQAAVDFPSMGHAVVEVDGAPHRMNPGNVNLGLAVDAEGKDGRRRLLVPVIKRADTMSFREFYDEYERLVAGARNNKLMPDSYMGGTITLTNPGTIGTVASVPRLMARQGSIIATGAIQSVADVRVMTLTSTYDHRIIQGAESGLFLQAIDRLLNGGAGFYQGVATAMDVDPAVLASVAVQGTGVAQAAVPVATSPKPAASQAAALTGNTVPAEMMYHVAAAKSLVKAHRMHGHLAAYIDPLGTEPIGDPALHPEPLGLTPEVMAQIPAKVLRVYVDGETLADAFPNLQATYLRSIAYEIEYIASHEQRVWLRRVVESGQHRTPMTKDEQRQVLSTLIRIQSLESFLHRTYLGQKRFSIEGLDMLVPMLRHAVRLAGDQGANEVVMGMAHRGRLSVLSHVLGVPTESLLAEFEGAHDVQDTLATQRGTGDVKYHYGASGTLENSHGGKVNVILMPNPSHLEAVNPVVEGHTRASQTEREGAHNSHHPERVMPVLIHGDAAFAAQGVVAETLNLAALPGYNTGGTLHIIANNQIGFTTDPRDARSTDFASDLAKGFDVPIAHVNADDPEACIAAVRLAMMYRRQFHNDFVINLIGYRRHGHNEGDEPRYTQPLMYEVIDSHPPVADIYASSLVDAGVVTEDEVQRERDGVQQQLTQALDRFRNQRGDVDQQAPNPYVTAEWRAATEPKTDVARDLLLQLNEQLLRVPDGFTVNKKLERTLGKRRSVVEEEDSIDWGHAEALAIASLLAEGVPLRLVGQDTERGTFSHRHMVLSDAVTGDRYAPMQHLDSATAPFELHNTPLSEYAALGFEYGYSVAAPETMVMWEAQFGDFVNGAEIIIDQFIIAGLVKWDQTSRLVLLLPHGYEGQGPEHSSARLERFLALGAEGNIRVANCSTPAQYFHLLRYQAKHAMLRPLVLMTPKSLLRHPQAVSSISELTTGRFHFALDDPERSDNRDAVTRLVLCSGKVYYDAIRAPQRESAHSVAIGRLELLYPFPSGAVKDLLNRYSNLKEVVWLQEEPTNMGARKWVVPQVTELLRPNVTIRSLARPERSSPAEGFLKKHLAEQERLVAAALT